MSKNPRAGCKDMWNDFMVKGAEFSANDIPLCPTTASSLPKSIITYSEARAIYRKKINGNPDFRAESFVCFYEDDVRFDGRDGIWLNPGRAYSMLSHFGGIIAPDFSTYLDFPLPIRMWNYYRMNAFGHWYGNVCHQNVIVNVRWNDMSSFDFCFDGIRYGESMVSIGTVASNLKAKISWDYFSFGLKELVQRKRPKAIIIYGAMPKEIFDPIISSGIVLFHYPSRKDREMRRLKDGQGK